MLPIPGHFIVPDCFCPGRGTHTRDSGTVPGIPGQLVTLLSGAPFHRDKALFPVPLVRELGVVWAGCVWCWFMRLCQVVANKSTSPRDWLWVRMYITQSTTADEWRRIAQCRDNAAYRGICNEVVELNTCTEWAKNWEHDRTVRLSEHSVIYLYFCVVKCANCRSPYNSGIHGHFFSRGGQWGGLKDGNPQQVFGGIAPVEVWGRSPRIWHLLK